MTKPDTSPEAIAALMDGVTAGPWHCNVRGFVGPVSTDDDQSFGMICDEVAECTFSNGSKEDNARFIAAARDLVPSLAAERDALTAEVARLRSSEAVARSSGYAEGVLASVRELTDAGDCSVTDALGQRLCCDGYHCGCQGSTVGEFLAHRILSLKGGDA